MNNNSGTLADLSANHRWSVVINGTALLSPFTGIAQYTRSLALALAALDTLDLSYFYYLRFSRTLRSAPMPGIKTSKRLVKAVVPFSYEAKRLVQTAAFLTGTFRSRFDLYHEPNFLPFRFNGPTVITAHDLSWLHYPQTHPADRVRIMSRKFGPALERAAHILTDAESVRQEILRAYPLAPDRITAVQLAARSQFRPRAQLECAGSLQRVGLEWRRFFLCVGTIEPRKNLELTLRAYAALAPELQARFPLAIVGMKGWLTSALERRVAPLQRAGTVRLLGFLSDDDLVSLNASARMLIYPSLYEGFGLPPLEAMASGTPVITSNVSSLPEVVGDAGVQIDPHDVDALRAAILRLAEDDAHWEALRSAGLARAAQFSWERCARETLAVYQKVLA